MAVIKMENLYTLRFGLFNFLSSMIPWDHCGSENIPDGEPAFGFDDLDCFLANVHGLETQCASDSSKTQNLFNLLIPSAEALWQHFFSAKPWGFFIELCILRASALAQAQ